MKRPKGFFMMTLILSICFCMLTFQMPSSAEQNGATVKVGRVTALKGSNIEVPITVDTSGLYAVKLKVTIPDGLTPDTGDFANDDNFPCVGLKAGSTFTDVSGQFINNVFTILLTNNTLSNVSGSDILLITLCLKVDESAVPGSTLPITVNVGQKDACDIDEDSVPVTVVSGGVTIEDEKHFNVDITWGSMDFTYSNGIWNPVTHVYDGAGWSCDEDDNRIIVKNNSVVAVNVGYTYEKITGFENINGRFTDGTGYVTSAKLSTGQENQVLLVLENKPNTSISRQKIGSVTVTVSEAD